MCLEKYKLVSLIGRFTPFPELEQIPIWLMLCGTDPQKLANGLKEQKGLGSRTLYHYTMGL